ncbi:MAG TPA: hypothetical protein ENJ09_07790 [Planctomycetes bacterium]|nr:hypothetical protein [Planctomycetota bacterium]
MTSSLLTLLPFLLPISTQGDDPAHRAPAPKPTVTVSGTVLGSVDADGDGEADTWFIDTDRSGTPDVTTYNFKEPRGSELAVPGRDVTFEIDGRRTENGYHLSKWIRFGKNSQRSSGGSSGQILLLSGTVIEARDTPVKGKTNGIPDSWDIDTNKDGQADITLNATPGSEPPYSELVRKHQRVEGALIGKKTSKSKKRPGYDVEYWTHIGEQ